MSFPPDEIPTKREKKDIYEILGGVMGEVVALRREVDRLNQIVLYSSVPPTTKKYKQIGGTIGIVTAVTGLIEFVKYIVLISGLGK